MPSISSRPMVIIIRPNIPATKLLKRFFSERLHMVENPKRTNINISAGPNLIANLLIKSTRITMRTKLRIPPMVETITAVPKAILA